MRQLGIGILLLLFSLNVQAETLLYQTLKSGVGIRALSMGGAYVALGEEFSGTFYNPAGLAIPGAIYSYENLDMQQSISKAFNAHHLYLGPMSFSRVNRESLIGGDSIEMTSAGYGRRGRNGIDWGLNFKNINQKGSSPFTGWTSDLGLLVHFTPQLNFGVVAYDFIKQDTFIPTTVAAGFSLFTKEKDFILTTDAYQYRADGQSAVYVRGGGEYHIADGLTLRGGIDQRRLSVGAGLMLSAMEIEYGIITEKDSPKGTQYMIGAKLGRGIDTYQRRRRYAIFKPKSFAKFAIGGNLVEGKSEISLLGGEKIGTNDLLTLIHDANKDKSCEGYIIRVGSITQSLTSVGIVQEIRKELENAKKMGKKIIVYLENWATLPEYYLATVADDIVMPELGTISHLGLEIEVTKTKSFLKNFGINYNVIASGAHKSNLLPESDGLTDSDKILLEELVGNLYHQVLFDIKESRSLEWESVSEIFDGRVISARSAKEKGLVDHLTFWDGVEDLIAKENENEKKPNVLSIVEYYQPPEPPSIFSSFNKIAVIEIDGSIHMGQNSSNFLFGGKGTGSSEISELLDEIAGMALVRGVIIRVNSPGGSLVASDQIYKAIERLKEAGKVVYTSMGNIAASGGYYVAMNSDKILANRGTLTGSIGVISVYQNFEGLLDIFGIDREVIKTGQFVDMMSSGRDLTEEEKDMLQTYQDEQYQLFVEKVMKNRNISQGEAEEIAQGQVFTGEQAVKLKIIDGIGNFYDTVDALAEEINIKDPELLFYRPDRPSLLSFLSPPKISAIMTEIKNLTEFLPSRTEKNPGLTY